MTEDLVAMLNALSQRIEIADEDPECSRSTHRALLEVGRILDTLAHAHTKTEALLREMIKARPDLAREKADAVPPEKFDDAQSRALETRLQVTEQGWASALRRAEAAEQKMESMRAELVESLAQRGRRRTELEQERDAALRRAAAAEKERDEVAAARDAEHENATIAADLLLVVKQERDALRADYERLSKLHEQDKAELVRWRKAAAELRNLFGADKPMGSPHYYAEDFVRVHLRATLKDAAKP